MPIQLKIYIECSSLAWSDEIRNTFQSRKINVINNDVKEFMITQNKTIMDYAVEYARCQDLKIHVLAPINHVRTSKRMHLPCELFGLNGRVQTKEYRNTNDKSTIVWNFKFD